MSAHPDPFKPYEDEIAALERKVAFWRNLYIEDECPSEDQIAAFDEAAAEEAEA